MTQIKSNQVASHLLDGAAVTDSLDPHPKIAPQKNGGSNETTAKSADRAKG